MRLRTEVNAEPRRRFTLNIRWDGRKDEHRQIHSSAKVSKTASLITGTGSNEAAGQHNSRAPGRTTYDGHKICRRWAKPHDSAVCRQWVKGSGKNSATVVISREARGAHANCKTKLAKL